MSDIKTYKVDEAYLSIDCSLGEGPYYEDETNTLRFVDIVKCQIHSIDLEKGPSSHKILAKTDISIATTSDIANDPNRIVFGGKHGIGILDKTTGNYQYIKKPWSDEEIADGKDKRMRANDGHVDSKGRFWVGYMNDPLNVDELKPEGAVFRLDTDLTLHRVIDGVTIPNGGIWSADDKHFYVADSTTSSIFIYDYDSETGNISNKRVLYHIKEDGCVPDGHCLDEEGYLWSAVHGMGKVLRISPEGKLVAEIVLPTRATTCPTFVGEDLFVTSAAEDNPEKYPTSGKFQGNLFRCHVGVKGLRKNKFQPSVQLP